MSAGQKRVLMWIGAGLAVIVLVLPKVGSLRGNSNRSQTATTSRDQTPSVRTYILKSEKLGDNVNTVGTILSNEEVELKSEISAKVVKIFFKEGSKVKKSDLLVKMNDAEQQAQLLRAQHRQTLAEQMENRQRQLHEKKLTSEEEHETAVTELNIVKAEVQVIKAQIDRSEIRAPFDGVIGLRYVSEGSYITPATRIATLQDNRTVKIDFAIPEKYAGSIKTGDKINFTIQGSSKNYVGKVYALDPKIDMATRTLNLRANCPNPNGALFPGAFANVEVLFKEKEALVAPAEAIIPELKGHKIFLLKDGKAVSQSVKTGIRSDVFIEITDGAQAGDTLITSAILQLRDGMAVRPALSE
jgi:membrane fusion protein (multidrug efflux system)